MPQDRHQWFRLLGRWALLVVLLSGGLFYFMRMPGTSSTSPLTPLSAAETVVRNRLLEHVSILASRIGERNIWHYDQLMEAEDYIARVLTSLGYTVRRQEYTIQGKKVANLEASLPGTAKPERIVVIGAHYDSVIGTPGADDNASGVAALLELARLLAGKPCGATIRWVAFVNEEPPFFMTKDMGSRVYAREARQRGEKIVAMISLECLGYFSTEKNSQKYPRPFSWFYPDTGDFIGFVGNLRSYRLVRQAIGAFRKATDFPSQGLAAPGWITGIGWSDQWSFWRQGYHAIMITDTALFRNPYYHDPQDTPEKLDYDRLARILPGLPEMVQELAGEAL